METNETNNYERRRNEMNEELILMLDEEIKAGLEGLSSLDYGSKEHSEAVENLTKLYKLRIEDSKAAMEYNKEIDNDQFRRDQMEKEEQSRKEQLAEQRIDRYVRIGIAAAELVVPIVFYNIWMKRGFKFEETGSFTSTTFRGLINRFRPTKR